VDPATGIRRPRQLGTYPSKRAALQAAGDAASDEHAVAARGTVRWLVDRWLLSRTDLGPKAKEQYAWAATHINAGLGAIRLDQLDRSDVAAWLQGLAEEGRLARRSVQICRTVLRAALADAVEEGLLRRSPAARVAMPRQVAKPDRQPEVEVWTDDQVQTFLAASRSHRWGGPLRLALLYGLRRSELLALRWDDVDVASSTVRVDEGLVKVHGGMAWTEGKSARSRRTLPVDPVTMRALQAHRSAQLQARLAIGAAWANEDLVVTTATGTPVNPRNFDHSLERIIRAAGLPRLTSHGLRHTAATHMTRHAADIGELRAAADILGHSPEMLVKVYAHALPEALRQIAERIAERAPN
jgi:integrase